MYSLRHPVARVAAPGLPAGLLVAWLVLCAGSSAAIERTYTIDQDFDEGVLISLNHDDPAHDQLQLNTTTSPLPFVNVACSGRGTVVRIDVNTCQILGEYLTSPDGMGRNPSRTTVDKFGNVWVSNRNEYGFSGDDFKGSVARIGVVIGGTRVDADGTPNPTGQYLKPPFLYSTCIDRDGDGLIKTSRGPGDALPWTNAGGADTHGGVSTAEDECIINYVRVAGTGTRTVAVDANNDLWTGGDDLDHEKVDGATGLPVAGSRFNLGCGGYGGLIDGTGVLWSARFGGGLLRYDTSLSAGACLGNSCGDYGLGIDPNSGHIWHAALSGNTVCELSPAGACLHCYPHGWNDAQGVAVDGSGNVWVAHSLVGAGATTVGHLRTDGTFVGVVPLPGGQGPTGVAVDANGKIWVANAYTNNAMRIDPALGPVGGGGFPIGAVDCTVDLGSNAYPYNYSDMTGFVAIGTTSPQGTWTVVYDSGEAGTEWGTGSWNSAEPVGTSVGVEVRAADNPADLPGSLFVAIANGVEFGGVAGRYIEIRATLGRITTLTDSPVLYDLTMAAANEDPVCEGAHASPGVLWPPDHRMVPIEVVGVTDPDGDPLTITVTGIHQDEPVNEKGDGNTCPDGVITGGPQVRAERCGVKHSPGNGRVYRLDFLATDGQGGSCEGSVTVCVPHDWSDPVCEDDGMIYDSAGDCLGRLPPDRFGDGYMDGSAGGAIAGLQVIPPGSGRGSIVEYSLTREGPVRLTVYDVAGRPRATLVDDYRGAGVHRVGWNTADLPSGLYYVRLESPSGTLVRATAVLK